MVMDLSSFDEGLRASRSSWLFKMGGRQSNVSDCEANHA